MKNFNALLIMLIVSLAIACKDNSKKEASNSLTIISDKSLNIKFSEIVNIGTLDIQDKTALIDRKNPLIIKKEVNRLTMCTLLAKDTMAIFFLDPNQNHKITIVTKGNNKINFVFDKDDYINNYTNYFHNELIPIMKGNVEQKPLLELIEKTENKLLKELQQIKSHMDNVSYEILTSMVTGKMTHIKFMQSERFKSLTANSTYFDFVDSYKFDDDNYLTYSDNLNTVLGVLEIQYERKFNKSFGPTTIDKFDFVNKSIKNKEVKSAVLCFLAGKFLPEQTEKEKELLLKQLNQFSISPIYLEHIKNIKANTAIGKKVGNKAKYLETLVPYDKDFSLKQLEGKMVYVDNWATWCGPCMKSMKAFKEKQKVLNKMEDIVFVFVSFDRNENIWRDYVKKSLAPNQKIIHLYNGIEMNSDYGRFYNILGLPSYWVIDKQGLIYDINPQTPKDEKFENYLNKL